MILVTLVSSAIGSLEQLVKRYCLGYNTKNMNRLRKFGLWLSALIVGPAVITAIVSFTFTRTIGSPDYVKQTFADVKIYEALGNFLQAQAKQSSKDENTTIQTAL